MADEQRMERTWLSSVLFMDIVNYSSQSVELQMKWKTRFNDYLAQAIQTVPKDERVILDTGDGAAVCFLGSPEAAMFAALQLWQRFVRDEQEQQPGLRVRIGVNLGPVKLVKDLNGSLNAIGDGINAGQRIMSFAPANQILVSQSFFEVVSRLSDDYKALFKLKGVETDKHVREHTVYSLMPPGSNEWNASHVATTGETFVARPAPVSVSQPQPPPPPPPSPPAAHPAPAAAPYPAVAAAAPAPRQKGSPVLVLMSVALVAGVALAGAAVAWWHFSGLGTKSPGPASQAVLQSSTTPATVPPPTASPENKAVAESAPAAPAQGPGTPNSPSPKQPNAPSTNTEKSMSPPPPTVPPSVPKVAAEARTQPPAPPVDEPNIPSEAQPTLPAQPSGANISGEAQSAYEQAMRLINQHQPAEAVPHLDRAIRASPGYAFAYLARAQAHRMLSQYETSIQDCEAAIRVSPQEPRVYFCRGLGEAFLKEWDLAAHDYGKAIRLNPDFVLAYEGRGVAYINLQQYERALEDLNQAIRLRPKNGQFYIRRAVIHENLNRYQKAIEDYNEAIRLEPSNAHAYIGRARAKKMAGDEQGAEADRRYARQLRQQ